MNGYKHTSLVPGGPDKPARWVPHTPAPAPKQDHSIKFSLIWETLYRGKWIILCTTLLVVGIATLVTLILDPVYRAESIVSIAASSTPVQANIQAGRAAEPQHTISSELGILEYSVELAERVATNLQEAARATGSNAFFPVLKDEAGWIQNTQQIASRLMRQVRFVPYSTQNMIGISVESTVPEEAALIANFYAEEYEKFSRERSRASVAAARAFLEKQAERRRQGLQSLENHWEAFVREEQIVKRGEGGERAVTEYTSLRMRRDEAAFELENEQVSISLLEQQLARIEPGLEETVRQERSASEKESQIAAIDQRLAELKLEAEKYYGNNPALRGNEAQVPALEELVKRIKYFSDYKTRLTDEYVAEVLQSNNTPTAEGGQVAYVGRLREQITQKQIRVRELQAQIDAMDARLLFYEGTLQSIPRQAIQQEQLKRKLDQAERWYNTFEEQLQLTLIAEESELGYVKVERAAFAPRSPVRPKFQQNILLGLLLGMGFGVALACIRQAVNTRFSSPEDLTEQGYHLIGVVPQMDQEIKASFGGRETIEVRGQPLSTRLLTLLDPWSPIAENFRLIRTNIQFVEPGRPLQTLLVTSPEVADGKSVTAVNTAIVMAQTGRRTLLIDADLRRPGAHKLLGVERAPGLADILSDRHPYKEEELATDLPNLFFLPAGRVDALPAELFGLEHMKRLLDTVRQRFDFIIIDSPPVLVVTDAVLLSVQCDATVIVVSANKTDLRALEVTRETLEKVGAPIVGTIINRFDASQVGSYKYKYSYGYYHDHSYSGKPE